jgi:hypothetical protein
VLRLIRLTGCVLALGFAFEPASSYAGHGPKLLEPVNTKDQISALKPGSTVVMACGKCKTVQIAEVDRNHGILGWSQPKTKHLCPTMQTWVFGSSSRSQMATKSKEEPSCQIVAR